MTTRPDRAQFLSAIVIITSAISYTPFSFITVDRAFALALQLLRQNNFSIIYSRVLWIIEGIDSDNRSAVRCDVLSACGIR
jgi:hypothetical protein